MKRISNILFSTIITLLVVNGMSATGYAANESSNDAMVTKGWNKTTVSSCFGSVSIFLRSLEICMTTVLSSPR